MLINYQNLTIRNAVASDAEQLVTWWNDGEIMAHAGFPNGVGDTAENIINSLKSDSDDTYRRLIIEVDGSPIGEMSYRNMGEGIAEIGIKICDFTKQNKGFGKKLLSMLVYCLFNNMGYKSIILDTNFNNKRAQYTYEQLGFKKVREKIDSWKNQLGQLQSSIDYELEQKDFINFAK